MRACFEVRRWGTLKEAFRLSVWGSSSESESSSAHSPGYCRLKSCSELRRESPPVMTSLPSTCTVSVLALPFSSITRRVFGLRISGIAFSEPPLCLLRGEDRREMVLLAADTDDRESIETGRIFRKPLSVLLRCRLGLALPADDDELVLDRECWFLDFLAICLSLKESSSCVSYGSLFPMFCCGTWSELSNEALGPWLEKLNSMLGSTPPEGEMNEFGLEWSSPALLKAKESMGPVWEEDRAWSSWKDCEFKVLFAVGVA